MTATVRILMNHERNRRNKLADAEVHFTGGELDGLKLMGFAVWKHPDGEGIRITVPARQFVMHGERRDFMLLRPIEDPQAVHRMRDAIAKAFEAELRSANQSVNH
jgi:hypothetical protein